MWRRLNAIDWNPELLLHQPGMNEDVTPPSAARRVQLNTLLTPQRMVRCGDARLFSPQDTALCQTWRNRLTGAPTFR